MYSPAPTQTTACPRPDSTVVITRITITTLWLIKNSTIGPFSPGVLIAYQAERMQPIMKKERKKLPITMPLVIPVFWINAAEHKAPII